MPLSCNLVLYFCNRTTDYETRMEGENSKPSDDLGSQKYHLRCSPSLIYFTTEARPERLEWWVWL